MGQRRETKRPPPRGLFARAGRAVASDVALGARVSEALAGTTGAGIAAGLALVLLLGQFPLLLAGAAGGATLGLALAAWAIADRRHTDRAGRARRRAVVTLTLLSLGVPLAAVALSPRSAAVIGLLGLLLALVVAGVGVGAMRLAARVVPRAAAERRARWHAQLRASRLTRRMLGGDAYRQLRRDGALPVDSTLHQDRVYLVPLRTTPSGARILVLQGGRPIGGLCLRPREPLPDPEEALAHILAIRSDERAWLARANFFPQDRALTPQARGLLAGRPGNYDR